MGRGSFQHYRHTEHPTSQAESPHNNNSNILEHVARGDSSWLPNAERFIAHPENTSPNEPIYGIYQASNVGYPHMHDSSIDYDTTHNSTSGKGKEIDTRANEVNYSAQDITDIFNRRYEIEYEESIRGYVKVITNVRPPEGSVFANEKGDLVPQGTINPETRRPFEAERHGMVYTNAVNPDEGRMVIAYVYKDRDREKWDSLPTSYKENNSDIAEPLPNFEILWQQYTAVAEDKPLTRMTVSDMVNERSRTAIEKILPPREKKKDTFKFVKDSKEYAYLRDKSPNLLGTFSMLKAYQSGSEVTKMRLTREERFLRDGKPYDKYSIDLYID